MKIETTGLPVGIIEFAKTLAASAKGNGIKSFTTKIELDRDMYDLDRSFNGNLTINFSAKDGRGRPCDNLSVSLDTHLTQSIVYTPESCS